MNALADQETTTQTGSGFSPKQLIAGAVSLVAALLLATVAPSTEIAWVVAILALTIYLFAFEVVGWT